MDKDKGTDGGQDEQELSTKAQPDTNAEVAADERFNPPSPSPWKRTALILLVCLLCYFGFHMRASLWDTKPKVIYASRYSKDHKFRPAASPVITETLKDGRVRVRGAYPTPTVTPTPPAQPANKRRRGSRKSKRKRSAAGTKR